jgi:hypothetical protein
MGGDVADPASWRNLPRPFFTGGGDGCVVDTRAGTQLVYHRKLGADPGWADREIRSAPLGWDADGYPVLVSTSPPSPKRRPDAVRDALYVEGGMTSSLMREVVNGS